MKITLFCLATFSLVAGISFATAQAAPQATDQAPQQFTVLRTGHLVAGTESLSAADVNCSIAGAGGGATMQCRRADAGKGSYHYNTALVVDPRGVGYVVACRVPLVLVLCKKLDTGATVEGRVDKGILAMDDGGKVRRYQILASATVGTLPLSPPPPSNNP